MSVEDITEKILEDAEIECERIRKESAEETKKIKEELEKEKKEVRKKYQSKLENELERKRDRILSNVKQQRSLENEELLRNEIVSVFQAKYEELIALNSDEYVKMLIKLIRANELDEFKGTCFTPAKRKKETQNTLTEIKINETVDVVESEDPSFKGGLIFENEKEYYDLSFETLISSIQANHEEKIRTLLLGS